MEKNNLTGSIPVAFVTKGRQRLKQYDNIVYLNNNDEFELELLNKTTTKVLARIELNGASIGSGIVLKPGERVFLERYLDVSKKFLFETYNVDGDDKEILKAISKNGDVTVKFYREETPPPYINTSPILFVRDWHNSGGTTGGYQYPSFTTTTTSYSTDQNSKLGGRKMCKATSGQKSFSEIDYAPDAFSRSFTSTTDSIDNTLGTMSMSMFSSDIESLDYEETKSESSQILETGRVGKGSESNQSFTYDSSRFEKYSSWEVLWKILPVSQKLIEKEDLKVYCPICGNKRKKDSHKFCPNCGNKF
jgi:hypothetical protein